MSIKEKNNFLSSYNAFLAILGVNVVLIGLSILLYGEKYYFWNYPLSYAGMAYTYQNGLVNIASMYIYGLSMGISSLIILTLAIKFFREKSQTNSFQALLLFLCAGGFLIAAISPDDTRYIFHVIGSALFVASLWLIATNFLFILGKELKRGKYILLLAILQVPILAYALTYFLNLMISNYLQKIAFLALFGVLIYTSRLLIKK